MQYLVHKTCFIQHGDATDRQAFVTSAHALHQADDIAWLCRLNTLSMREFQALAVTEMYCFQPTFILGLSRTLPRKLFPGSLSSKKITIASRYPTEIRCGFFQGMQTCREHSCMLSKWWLCIR